MKKLFLIILMFMSIYNYGINVPKNNGFVTDNEDIFTPSEEQQLTEYLSNYEKQTTIEIAILTISEYDGDIFDVAQEIATNWGIGKDSTNNGLLFIISKNNKTWRIHTGYGLEGYLPDGWLKTTGDEMSKSYFKNDKFYDGVIYTLNECKQRIDTEGGYTIDNNIRLVEQQKEHNKNIMIIIIILIIVLIILCIVFPDFGILILSIVLSSGDSDSGDSFGGGDFGGGGAGGGW